jgi:hypothetical protein
LILKCKHFCHYKEELCGFRIRRLKIQPTTIDPYAEIQFLDQQQLCELYYVALSQ